MGPPCLHRRQDASLDSGRQDLPPARPQRPHHVIPHVLQDHDSEVKQPEAAPRMEEPTGTRTTVNRGTPTPHPCVGAALAVILVMGRTYATVKGMIMPSAACGAPVAWSGTKQIMKYSPGVNSNCA